MPDTSTSASQQRLRSRIAPTPSGYLHKGNGFSFVLSWVLMRLTGGHLLLRIDDADTSRARPEFINDLFYSLDWLGLDWDEGPSGPDDFQQHFSQAKRFAYYQQLLAVLVQGGGVYACACSRSQVKAEWPDGIYRGSCRTKQLSLERKGVAWRMAVPEGAVWFTEVAKGARCLPLAERMGDFAVRRKDGIAAYQIASLADDLAWGTNFIVRGEDLLESTAAQVFLAGQLAKQGDDANLQQKATHFQKACFLHHPLLLDEKGEKLSKSAGSTALKSLREAGGTPMPVYALVADFLHLPADAAASLPELLQAAQESPHAKALLAP